MKVRTSIAAISAATLVGAGVLMIPVAASANNATHTLKFESKQHEVVGYGTVNGAASDDDLSSGGQLIGFDVLSYTGTAGGGYDIGITVDVNGGFLYGAVSGPAHAHTYSGKVTGGTGAFQGATGTITATNLNKSGTHTEVTIVYST